MGYRKIEIDGETWEWKCGRSNLDIKGPNGQRYKPTCAEVKGLLNNDIVDRGRHKINDDGMVTPKDVATWVRECAGGAR